MKKKLIYGLVITALMSCGDRNSKTSDIETPSDKYAELNIQARAIFGDEFLN